MACEQRIIAQTEETKTLTSRRSKKYGKLVYQSIAWKYICSIFYVLDHQNDTKDELPKIYLLS